MLIGSRLNETYLSVVFISLWVVLGGRCLIWKWGFCFGSYVAVDVYAVACKCELGQRNAVSCVEYERTNDPCTNINVRISQHRQPNLSPRSLLPPPSDLLPFSPPTKQNERRPHDPGAATDRPALAHQPTKEPPAQITQQPTKKNTGLAATAHERPHARNVRTEGMKYQEEGRHSSGSEVRKSGGMWKGVAGETRGRRPKGHKRGWVSEV